MAAETIGGVTSVIKTQQTEERLKGNRLLSLPSPTRTTAFKKFVTGAFSQQRLWAWRPLLTPVAVSGILLFISVLFIPFGLSLLDASELNVYQRVRYDNLEGCKVTADDDYTTLPKICSVTFTIDNDMDKPVYFYYEITDFAQNHRKYKESKSDSQLRDDGAADNGECKPFKDFEGKGIYPCGLVARSFFSDRFRMSVEGQPLCNERTRCVMYGSGENYTNLWNQTWSNWRDTKWQRTGIAWKSDKDEKFKSVGNLNLQNHIRQTEFNQQQGLNIPEPDDEDLIVWMRIAALPKFRKLHRIIDMDLKEGDNVTVDIASWFPVDDFNGKKHFALGTTTWAGTENTALAWSLIGFSLASVTIAFLIAVGLLFGTRKLAVVDIFDWHNRPKTQSLVKIAH